MDLSPTSLSASWSRLSQPWQLAFTLQWEAFTAGDIAIAAVLVDGAGAVVSTGRNRRYSGDVQSGELAGNGMAHAEVNALAKLPYGFYPDHTLLSTFEPCLLCSAALRICHIGRVEFAAADPLWRNIDQITTISPHIARHWATRVGPSGGPMGDWACLLALLRLGSPAARGRTLEQYLRDLPEVIALARRIVTGGHLDTLRGVTLSEAFETIGKIAEG
jgi:tRNA(Arg) A34 adenosine deaminase TadA